MKRAAALAVALALLCAACDERRTIASPASTAPAPVTTDQWLGRYAIWVTDLRVALLHADRDALGRCAQTLNEKLAEAPGRLQNAERILALACERVERGARADDADEAFLEWSQAAHLIRDANSRLPTPQPMERLPLPVGTGLSEASRVEPLFTRVARGVAAAVGEVRCWSPSDWRELQAESFGADLSLAGFASTIFKRVNLGWDICDGLATLAYTNRRPRGAEQLQVAAAVATLMHETGHLNESGDFYGAGQNEALAECWGMQHIRDGAVALGASKPYADELAERYWTELYPKNSADYRSPKCRDGGAYDLNNASSVWP